MAKHSATTAHPQEHPASWGGNPDQAHANDRPEPAAPKVPKAKAAKAK